MIWHVYYTADAGKDLQSIYEYISLSLLAPQAAKKQVTRIMDAVDSLEEMPLRYRAYDKEPWRTKGLRLLPVDNYLVFYLPVESQSTVVMIRIMYGGRDIENQIDKAEKK